MGKTIRRILLLSAVLAVGACQQPYPLYYYPAPEPAPLQPYMGPVVAPAPAPKRVVKHYRKRHHRVRCRCVPAT